ncbi:MAG: two-component regulator propeller domain-containing protein [Bryobacteraceae bacterium]
MYLRITAWVMLAGAQTLLALDPDKAFTQYSRAQWTQAQGLPQDSVRAIMQTPDGYLWLGTSEGLVRFDGYDFVTYTKRDGHLPSNSVITLALGQAGKLLIGTSEGLAAYENGKFRSYPAAEGLPSRSITSVVEQSNGDLWTVSAGTLCHIVNGKPHRISEAQLGPVQSPRVVYEDGEQQLWVAGVGGVVKLEGKAFVPVLGPEQLGETVINRILKNRDGLWMAGGKGLVRFQPGKPIQRYTTADGLPNDLVLELMEDHTKTLWVGTYNGFSRLRDGRFEGPSAQSLEDRGLVWSLYEDREGNLWVGAQNALMRLRDDPFTIYGKPEGLPSDAPMAVHEDKAGRLWVAFRDSGLTAFRPGQPRTFTTKDGLPSNEIYGIRDGAGGDLLISSMGGLSRMSHGTFTNYQIPDPGGRTAVHDAVMDHSGQIWAATPSGVFKLREGKWQAATPSSSNPVSYTLVLSEGPDQSIWAGTFLDGLWWIQGGKARLYTTADGLGSNQIRSLLWDEQHTLWIGAFDGGLTRFRDGTFQRFRASDGLLSDNIGHVDDDRQGSLWLSTTRGLCRISKQQLDDFAAGKIKKLTPVNYGSAEGLRSTLMAPSFPAGGGGTLSKDGRLWFSSSNGLVSMQPGRDFQDELRNRVDPVTRIVAVKVDDQDVNADTPELPPGFGRIEFSYVGLHLSAPESLQYAYKLEGQDKNWISAQGLRRTSYHNLPHGDYRFLVRATNRGGQTGEAQYRFTVLPHYYETVPFLLLMTAALGSLVYGAYRYRLRQVQTRFAMVVEERARLAREIHDTLAQGFVGISHQLDALSGTLDGDPAAAHQQLDLARKMTRHSLTEARRSMIDLRDSELQGQSLPQALSAAARRWVAGRPVEMKLDVMEMRRKLPLETEQNLFRIAQEAVANALKHAEAHSIAVQLNDAADGVVLTVADDGKGFDPSNSFSGIGGHFGIIGMRERAEREGGTFSISSEAGRGTLVEVTVGRVKGEERG